MATTRKKPVKPAKAAKPAKAKKAPALSEEELDALIEEATVDCYNEYEQLTGFDCCITDNLEVPFETDLLGEKVTVESIGPNDANELVATCKKGKHTLKVSLDELLLPNPPPKGSKWVQAYLLWRSRR